MWVGLAQERRAVGDYGTPFYGSLLLKYKVVYYISGIISTGPLSVRA